MTTRATVLAPGVALLPPLPAALFWDGAPVLEQALAVNSTPHTMRRFGAAFGAGFREVQVGDEIRVEGRH